METSNTPLGNVIYIHFHWQVGEFHPALDYKPPTNNPFPLNLELGEIWMQSYIIGGLSIREPEGNLSMAGIWNSSNYCALLLLLNEKVGLAELMSAYCLLWECGCCKEWAIHFQCFCLFISSYGALGSPSRDKIPVFFLHPHSPAPVGVFRIPPSIWINKVTGEESVSLIKATLKGSSTNFPLQMKNSAK